MTLLEADPPTGRAPSPPDVPQAWAAAADGLLCAIPTLGLSTSDRQTVTIRARMLVESAARGPASGGDAARHARRLRAVLRATGNPAAAALAAGIAEQPPLEPAAGGRPARRTAPGA